MRRGVADFVDEEQDPLVGIGMALVENLIAVRYTAAIRDRCSRSPLRPPMPFCGACMLADECFGQPGSVQETESYLENGGEIAHGCGHF